MYFLKSQPFVISASATKESKAASFSLANIELINPEKEHKQKEKDVLIAKPCTEATSKIKKYLDNHISFPELAFELVPLVGQYRIACIEVDKAILKVQDAYNKKIEKLKSSKKYLSSNDEEKEEMIEALEDDLLCNYNNWLVEQCSLSELLNSKYKNYNLPYGLIDKYSYKILDIYSKCYFQNNRIYSINENNKKRIDRLIEVDLAVNLSKLDSNTILEKLSIKNIKYILGAPIPKGLKTKKEWVDFAALDEMVVEKARRLPEIVNMVYIKDVPGLAEMDAQELVGALKYFHEYAWAIAWYTRYKAERRWPEPNFYQT